MTSEKSHSAPSCFTGTEPLCQLQVTVTDNPTLTALERTACVDFEADQAGWLALLDVLHLPQWAYPAVRTVLRAGHWRQAKNPPGYVHMAAKRMAQRQGLLDPPADPAEQLTASQADRFWHTEAPAWRERIRREFWAGDGLNWECIAEHARLDLHERQVLVLRMQGCTRAALAQDHRLLAAWPRLTLKLRQVLVEK